jgi:hypothetical protein
VESAGTVVAIAVFLIAWVVGVASWFLGLAESLGMWRFKPLAFRLGLVGLREDRVLPNPYGRLPVGEPFETQNGKFILTPQDGCLFRSRFQRFGFRLHTPFPMKGSVRWVGDHAHIECRIPMFPMVFMAAWIVGWTTGLIMLIVSEGEGAGAAIGLAFFAIGVGAVVAMTALSIRFERGRAVKLVAELEARLNSLAGEGLRSNSPP